MRRQIMFVTYLTDGFQKAFAYSTELARMMDKDLAVLIISRQYGFSRAYENYMTAASFAESGEHEIAREFMLGTDRQSFAEELSYLWERCHEKGIKLSVHRSDLDIVAAINSFVSQERGIDMILIGSTITDNRSVSARELKRLVKSASRPVVTIGKEAGIA